MDTNDASPTPENALAKSNSQKFLEKPTPNVERAHIKSPIEINVNGCFDWE